mgnify:CR=1 FL=1
MEENKEPTKKPTTTRKSAPKKTVTKEEVVENDLQAQMQQMMQMMAQQQQMFMAMMQQAQMQQAQPIQETKEKPKKQTRVNKGTVKDRGMTKQGLRRKYRDTDIYVQSVFQGSVFYKGKKDDYSWDVKGEVLPMHIDDIIAMPYKYLHEPWLILDDYENNEEVLDDIISALELEHMYRNLFILNELEENINNIDMKELKEIINDNKNKGGSLHLDVTAIVQQKINIGELNNIRKIGEFEKILGRSFNK